MCGTFSFRYADTLIQQRGDTQAKGQEFLTWNDVQKCIDTVNVQVQEEHERKKLWANRLYLFKMVCGMLRVRVFYLWYLKKKKSKSKLNLLYVSFMSSAFRYHSYSRDQWGDQLSRPSADTCSSSPPDSQTDGGECCHSQTLPRCPSEYQTTALPGTEALILVQRHSSEFKMNQ